MPRVIAPVLMFAALCFAQAPAVSRAQWWIVFSTEIPPQPLGLKEVKGLTSQGQPRTPATRLATCSRNWTEAVIESLRPT